VGRGPVRSKFGTRSGAGGRLEPRLTEAGGAIDDRFHSARFMRGALAKVFPDHWSFFLGEMALYSFVILILTGIYLTFFFVPSLHDVVYHGSYAKLDGVHMSEAYRSTLDISFDVRGGLLIRQIHHWAALVFVGSICLHILRIFFSGAFRKPREINWIIGTTLFLLACVEGFCGYSLPDDLLSGTGMRIAQGIMLSIPVVGTYVSFFFFGGQYPGEVFITRLYIVHVLLIPGLLLALIAAHLMVLWHQGHTQWPGRKQRDDNEVGDQMFPVFAIKTTALFFMTFGVLAFLGAIAQINPIYEYGPYTPLNVTSSAQPDWYFGFLEGTLRMMPGVASNTWGHTWAWNVFIPAVLLPVLFFLLMYAYPFFEQWVTGDRRPHQVLDRPRNMPARTALGAAIITMAAIIQLAGADDVIALHLSIPVEFLVYAFRAGFFVLPVVVYIATRRACLSLQRADRRKLRRGMAFGIAAAPTPPDGHQDSLLGGQQDQPGRTDGKPASTAYLVESRPPSGEERAVLETRRPDELITPVPRHLVPLPTPRRAVAQVRARLNHAYVIPRLETPSASPARTGDSEYAAKVRGQQEGGEGHDDRGAGGG
jgi:ubiquinol-cytochrome c reductase cytochrome b subunit